MRYVSAYLLAVLGGNASPSVSDLENILGAVGIDADSEKAKTVVGRLQGKTIEQLIAEGSKNLVAVSGGAAPAAAAAPAAGGAAAAPAEEKKKKEEPKEESDDDMGFGLFD